MISNNKGFTHKNDSQFLGLIGNSSIKSLEMYNFFLVKSEFDLVSKDPGVITLCRFLIGLLGFVKTLLVLQLDFEFLEHAV